MADETIKSVISVEVEGNRDVNLLIDGLSRLSDEGGEAGRAADALQKQLVKQAQAARQAAQANQRVADSYSESANALRKYITEYNNLQRSPGAKPGAGALNEQFPLLQHRLQTEAAAVKKHEADLLATWDRQYKAQADAAQKYENDLLATWDRQYRVQEQTAQARLSLDRELNRERLQGAQETNRQLNQIEQNRRQQELDGLRQAIQERARQQDQANKAQLAYAKEARTQGVRYGEEVGDSLITQRYALYDVATTWGIVSAATLGAAAAATKAAIDQEAAFAQVLRTTDAVGDRAIELQGELQSLGAVIPRSFGELSEIAALGGQLGIATEGIEEFTRVTAMLESTSDLTADTAATMIGRFQALMGVAPQQFENLASSISLVAVNSVATETQIATIATQISSMGTFAGLTADQVVGLSAALASVGVQPELARGTVTRTFTLMSQAVAEGGARLDEFARVSGVSAEQFKAAWGTEEFAGVFQQFLRGISGEGERAVATLRNLGITSVRDVPALMRLADAGDVVTQSFADAASGWSENTELARQFAEIAETVSAKFARVGSVLQSIIANAAEGPLDILGSVLDVVLTLSEKFLELSRNPVGKWFAGLAIAATAVVGAVFGIMSALALAMGSLYAMRTAMGALNGAGIRSTGIFRQYRDILSQLIPVKTAATAAQRAYNAALTEGTGRAAALSAGLRAGTAAAGMFGTAVRGALVSTGIGIALVGVGAAVQALSNNMRSGADVARDYFGDLTGLSDALKKDTAEWRAGGEAIRTMTSEISVSHTSAEGWVGSLERAAGVQVDLNDNTTKTTDGIIRQTIAIGENARAWLAQQIANNEDFQNSWRENADVIQSTGFVLQDFLDASLATEGGGLEYLDTLTDKYRVTLEELDRQMMQAQAGQGAWTAEQEASRVATEEAILALDSLRKGVNATDESFGAASAGLDIMSGLMGETEAGLGIAEDAVEGLNNALMDLYESEFAIIDSTIAVQNAMYALGGSLYENGASFDVFSAEGRANMEALSGVISAMVVAAGDDSAALATMLAGLMNELAAYGIGAAGELAAVEGMIAVIVNRNGIKLSMDDVRTASERAASAIGGGYRNAVDRATKANQRKAKSARDAAKEIRTLSDYVKDLSGVFRDAFEFRFGLDQSIDGVAEAYQKLVDYSLNAAEAVRDAQQAIRDADAEIRGLQAARGTLEYQLRVAQEYGDTLRANEILAELAKNEEELRKKQRDRTKSQRELDKAQDASRKSLDGQTEGSREQRELVLDLLSAYQDQVKALANTGLSQDDLRRRTEQLRQQFMAQLRQLGYNEREVQRYAKSFDDLTYAINNVPRNITVDANTDPAIRALNEFLARANNSRATIQMDAAGGGTFRPSGIDVGNGGVNTPALNVSHTVTRDLHIRELLSTPRWQERYPHTPIPRATGGPVPEYHATGGVHGLHPGKPMGTDTTPAWLTPGEYVHQKKAVQYYGLPFMNALNNMQIPRYLANGSGSAPRGGNTGIAVVELSATDRALLAAAGNVTLTVDGRVLARTVNKSNANNAARGGN